MTKKKLLICIFSGVGFVAMLALFLVMLLLPKTPQGAPETQQTTMSRFSSTMQNWANMPSPR